MLETARRFIDKWRVPQVAVYQRNTLPPMATSKLADPVYLTKISCCLIGTNKFTFSSSGCSEAATPSKIFYSMFEACY